MKKIIIISKFIRHLFFKKKSLRKKVLKLKKINKIFFNSFFILIAQKHAVTKFLIFFMIKKNNFTT